MYDDMSEAKNSATLAISSGLPTLLMLVLSKVSASASFEVLLRIMSVSVNPGAMALTRIFWPPNSLDSTLVREIIAALLEAYAERPSLPSIPALDEILTMLPVFCRTMILTMD